MIKLFRKIRQTMIKENKFSKYLLYAIGEIVLVVIGILIALQINNWNENQKSAKFELQLLYSFKSGLKQDLADAEGNIKWHRRGLEALDSLFLLLESNKPYDINRVSRMFSDALTPTYFQYSTSAFETLKSNGITTITNDSLRDRIIQVYDSQYVFFLKYEADFAKTVGFGFTEVLPPLFKDSYNYDLSSTDFAGAMVPLDFEALKTNQEFLYFLRSYKNRLVILLDWQYVQLNSNIKGLLSEIDREITKLVS